MSETAEPRTQNSADGARQAVGRSWRKQAMGEMMRDSLARQNEQGYLLFEAMFRSKKECHHAI